MGFVDRTKKSNLLCDQKATDRRFSACDRRAWEYQLSSGTSSFSRPRLYTDLTLYCTVLYHPPGYWIIVRVQLSTVSTTMRNHNKVPFLAAVCGGQGMMEVGESTDECVPFLVNCCRFVWGKTEET